MILDSILALILLLAGGSGTVMLLLPKRDWLIPELAGLAVPLGLGVVSGAWFALGFALSGSLLRWAVAVICMGLFLLGWRRFVRLKVLLRRGCGWATLVVWGTQLAVITWQSLGRPLTADGLFIWELKAKLAYLHGGAIPAAYFGLQWRDLHTTYPLGVPLVETWMYAWIGEPHQGALKLFCPLLFLAGVCLLWTVIWRITGDSRKSAITSILLFFVPWGMFKPGGVVSGWADFPLAIGYLGLLLFVLEAVRTGPGPVSFASAGPLLAFLALLPWIKQEGLILALSATAGLGLAWIIGSNRRRSVIVTAFLAAVPITVAIAWRGYLASKHAASNADFSAISLDALAENSHRCLAIGILLMRELTALDRWGLLWPVALMALIVGRQQYPRESTVLAVGLMLPCAVFSGSYIFSTWPNFAMHVNSSLSRLLIPLAMPALVAIGLVIPPKLAAKQSD